MLQILQSIAGYAILEVNGKKKKKIIQIQTLFSSEALATIPV